MKLTGEFINQPMHSLDGFQRLFFLMQICTPPTHCMFSLIFSRNIYRELATQDDEIPIWDDAQRNQGSSQRSPLMQSMMRPQNDGIGSSFVLLITLSKHT